MRAWQTLLFYAPEASADFVSWCLEREQAAMKAVKDNYGTDKAAQANGESIAYEALRKSFQHEAIEFVDQIEKERKEN